MTSLIEEDKKKIFIELMKTDMWIHRTNIAMELAIEENNKKINKTDKKLVLEEYHNYLDIFNEEKAHWFPESRPWDHKIEMKKGFEPKLFKNYNFIPAEQIELDKFLKENLENGYIRPSQLPMVSPFFFVPKKDGKLRPCQDYWYLNDWTIKNSYPLPLILEIMDELKGTKYFNKLEYIGDTIIYKSEKETNEKPLLKLIKDFRTNGNVLWNVQFPGNFLSYDRQYLHNNNWQTTSHCIHGQHTHLCWHWGRTQKNNKTDTMRTWPLPKS
jgi:hypothetical protein